MNENLYWLGFSVFQGIGSKRFRLLLKTFDSAQNAWEADLSDLERVLGKALSGKFYLFRKKFDLQRYEEKIISQKIQYVCSDDENYPRLLKNISNPPFLLYLKGNVSLLNLDKPIAVVGTRKITQYGREVTRFLTSQLVLEGFVIVSGLAFGVDAVAHETTIENKGKTIAVLGCGVDCCTPLSNQYLYDRILESGGAVVSSFAPRTKASKGSFPARNGIIAGLSLGVLVTEGTKDSGALITAEKAKEFGRSVFAVPGPITSNLSKGANSLLQKGAVAVTSAEDILKVLKITPCHSERILRPFGSEPQGRSLPKEESKNLTQQTDRAVYSQNFSQSQWDDKFTNASYDEQEIMNMLQLESLHFDQIVRKIGEDAKTIGSLLSLMELKGMIKNNQGVYSLS